MLIKSSHKVKLHQCFNKILSLFAAFDDTFIFLGLMGLGQNFLTHVDKNGDILYQHRFPKPIFELHMINERQCVFLETVNKWELNQEKSPMQDSCITVLNLESYKFTRTTHKFLTQKSSAFSLKYFPQTKLLCVQEQFKQKPFKLKLSYYQYPLTQSSKPISIYESKEHEWSKDYETRAVNKHSMMAWFRLNYHEEWMFKIFDLRTEPQGKLHVYRFSKNIAILPGFQAAELTIRNLWETTMGCFMIFSMGKRRVQYQSQGKGFPYVNLVLDTMTQTIRQAKFSLGLERDQIIQQTYLGPVSMLRVFDMSQGRPKSTPIFFLDNEKQEIVGMDSWEFNSLQKCHPSWAEPGLLIHNQYELGGCNWFECERIKTVQPKEISMLLMLAINENFDDDLLQDVTQMIDYSP